MTARLLTILYEGSQCHAPAFDMLIEGDEYGRTVGSCAGGDRRRGRRDRKRTDRTWLVGPWSGARCARCGAWMAGRSRYDKLGGGRCDEWRGRDPRSGGHVGDRSCREPTRLPPMG